MDYLPGDTIEYETESGEVRVLKVISRMDITLRDDGGRAKYLPGFSGQREEAKGYIDSYGASTHMVEYWGLDSQITNVIPQKIS